MKNFKVLSCLFLLLALFLVGCSDQRSEQRAEFQRWLEEKDKVKVLSTTAMIDDLVKQVGGDNIVSITLILGDLDPHSYQLVKGDDEKLANADIIFYNGVGLEHGPSLQHYLSNNKNAIGIGNYLDPASIIQVGGQSDPHIWMDISLWAKTLPIIVKTLSEKDPAHAKEYQANADKLQAQMMKTHKEVKELMHTVPEKRRYLVTSHDAFNYFARAYLAEDNEVADGSWSKRFASPEGLAPESQLSTTDIKFIIDYLKKYNISILFPETNVSRDSIQKIVQAGKDQGLAIQIATCCPLYADAMGPPGSEGDTYLKMIENDAKMLSYHMKGVQ